MTPAERLIDALAAEVALQLGGENYTPEFLALVQRAFRRHRRLIITSIYFAINFEGDHRD